MVTARLAIGSVSTLAIGALLLGSAPYWLHRSGGTSGTPWGAISALNANHAEAAQPEDRAQLIKLAALKSGSPSEAPPAAPVPVVPAAATPAPQPVTQAQAVPAQSTVAAADAAPAVDASATPAPAVEPQQQVASVEAPATADPAPEAAAPASDRVNINTASSSALDHLPGAGRIGHTIVSHRPYKSVKDLVSRRILRTSDFQKIQSHISVD